MTPPRLRTLNANPGIDEIRSAAALVLDPDAVPLSVACTNVLEGPDGAYSCLALALQPGDGMPPGFVEVWPARRITPDMRCLLTLTPYIQDDTPAIVLDQPGVIAGNVVFGIEPLAYVTDEPGVHIRVEPGRREPFLVRVFEENEMTLDYGAGTISPTDASESRERLEWRTRPSVRDLLQLLTS